MERFIGQTLERTSRETPERGSREKFEAQDLPISLLDEGGSCLCCGPAASRKRSTTLNQLERYPHLEAKK